MIGYKFGEFVNYKTFAHYVHIKKDKNRAKKNK
jgi:ribosomal protein S19